MRAREGSPADPARPRARLQKSHVAAVCATLGLGIFLFDLQQEKGVAIGALYAAVVLCGQWLGRVCILRLAALTSLLVVLGGWLSPGSGSPQFLMNRALSIAIIWTVAVLSRSRKRSEQKLAESEERYRVLVEGVPSGVLVHSKGTIRFANAEAARLVGAASASELVGRSILDIADPLVLEEARAVMDAIYQQGTVLESQEYRMRRLDGRMILVDLAALPIRFDGRPSAIVIFRDVTDRVQLRNIQRLDTIGRLAAGIAHDFNNLLTPILGYAELLLLEAPRGSRQAEFLSEICSSSERGRGLTRQLLSFGRKSAAERKALDLNQIVTRLANVLRRTIRENIEISLSLEPALPSIRGHAVQIEQVLMNLATNAQDAMPSGGRLTIETMAVDLAHEHAGSASASEVVLVVHDTGQGMDEETMNRLFEPFFTSKPEGAGTGIGLVLVQSIVESHGGSVNVRSTPGEGTTVEIRLPAADEEPSTSTEVLVGEPEPLRGSGETILVVDDEHSVRRIFCRALRAQGYRVLDAANAEEAVRLARQSGDSISLLLTDVVMPGASGPELYQQLAPRIPDLRVLFLSGYGEEEIARHGMLDAEGGALVVHKPVSMRELARKIRALLDARGSS